MPHIIIDAYHSDRQIEHLRIHAEIKLSHECYNSIKRHVKLSELKHKLEAVVEEYFDEWEVEELTNHEWNLIISNR